MGRPRICFIGAMLGGNRGWVLNQGEIMAEKFAHEGYPVRLSSTIVNRFLRLADTVTSIVSWRSEIDIAIIDVYSGPGFFMSDLSSYLFSQSNIPLIMILRGGALPGFALRHPRWAKRVLRRARAVVSPSGYLARSFNRYGFDVQVIPNVIELEQYPFTLRRCTQPRLLWMRTFHPLYNPEMAVEVLDRVIRTYPEATLTMAGQDKGSLGPVKHLAERKGLSGSIRFAGFLDKAGKEKEFSNHDIFLNTNRVDNMPVSIVEAAASGLPTVATAVGGVPYLLHNEETGLLVKDGDAAGMAEAVQRLITEPDLASRLSANGRLLGEACAWSTVKAQWERLFTHIQGPGAPPAPPAPEHVNPLCEHEPS